MTVESRSHTGCWTCRLRKRKCDEKKPTCSECVFLGLNCHGYAERPTWMDRGPKQKAQLTIIKQKVAEATRQRRMSRIHDKYESSLKRSSSNPTSGDSSINLATTATTIPLSQLTVSHETSVSYLPNDLFQTERNQIPFTSTNSIAVPDFDSAIDTSKFHAPLNAATYLLPNCYAAEDDLMFQHEVSLPKYDFTLHQYANSADDNRSIEEKPLDSCITGNKPTLAINDIEDAIFCNKIDWLVHLQAGTSIVDAWMDQNSGCFSCQPAGEQEDPESVKECPKVFLIGLIIRFDILSSLTRDSAPALSDKYRYVLKPVGHGIRLETILGCCDWVFSILLDVYALRDWKKTAKAAGLLSLWELTSKASTIKSNLERNIALNFQRMSKLKQDLKNSKDENAQHQDSEYSISTMTHIFACSVSVLLEVIVSGAHPQLPEIKKEVGRALESYAYIDDLKLLHALCWPLFVVGCVAEPENYDIFRTLLSSPNITRIETFCELLQLLEKCWETSADIGTVEDDFDFTQARKYMPWDLLIA
ncbi:hypothetical protein B7463_g1279, partial [Scytalidium lignicola]